MNYQFDYSIISDNFSVLMQGAARTLEKSPAFPSFSGFFWG